MRYILNQELEERASGKAKRVAFFVAEKVALCFQQHHMLSTNLSFPIAKLHGDSPGMTSTKEFWNTQINDHMAIVCTAQVLLDGFNNGFLTMRQVNLLIFDEAHHAKKNHPFAKIIQSYYRGEPDPEKRPRIFGMTASPVDGQTRDMKDACSELEAMLDSRIATVSDEVLQANLEKKRLVESVATYDCLPDPEQVRTDLWKNIYGQISQNIELRASLDFSKGAASTLGPWCADRFWLLRMTDVEVMKLKAKTQNEFADMTVQHGVTSSDAVTAIKAVQEMVANTNLGSISRNSGLLSSKVRLLWDILDAEFRESPMKRCIVFVEKQFTAILLADLFQQPLMKIPSLKSAYMVSYSSYGSRTHAVLMRPGRWARNKLCGCWYEPDGASDNAQKIQRGRCQLPICDPSSRRGHRHS
jgi:endoribonuclease Dicer